MTLRRLIHAPQGTLALRCALGLLGALPLFGQLTITTTVLPNANVGQSYTAYVFASGGTGQLTWSATGLPPGLAISSNQYTSVGAITGTPTTNGFYQVTLAVNAAYGSANKQLTLLVSGSSQPLTITTPNTLTAGTVGQSYSISLNASGGAPPYQWSATSGLPAGLALTQSGTLSGTPTVAGAFSIAVQVTDSAQSAAAATFSLTIKGSAITITTAGTLPAGTPGQNYSISLNASGGTPPYQWAAPAGLPSGFALSQTGTLSGTPTTSGTFNFAVQVTDSSQLTATANFSLTINSLPLTIATSAPLFTGTVGVAYSQTFSASGGKPPYTWTIASGDSGGLVLGASTGVLSGTPQTAGNFNITVQAKDSAGIAASKAFTVVVMPPVLTITLGSPLPSGVVGVAYSQQAPAVATGGTPPYSWSIAGGTLAPGLSFDLSTLTISGTPTTTGTFAFTLQLTDASRQTASRSLSIAILPSALSITTDRQLPAGTLNAAYSATLAATGGAPPYSWSAAGLPDGLHMDPAAGAITGTPTLAGSFPVAITVSDGALNHASDRFTLSINLPTPPAVLVSGLPNTADPAQQYTIQVTLGAAFPAPITGQAILTFSPDTGTTDKTVQFASGGTTAAFSVPAGSTSATSDAPLAIQTGTVSGTVNVSIRLTAGGIDITPVPAPAVSARIVPAAPAIAGVSVSRSSGTIAFAVSGYSTAREVTQAVFTFAAASGQTLQSTASSLTVSVDGLFGPWFQNPANAAYGSQFVFTQPFTVQGDPNAVIPQSITLVNRVGSTTYTIH
jgi:hypothetical protein